MKPKPKAKILPAPLPLKLRSVVPQAVSGGHNLTAPAIAAARLPRKPTRGATTGNHALHHAPRNAQS